MECWPIKNSYVQQWHVAEIGILRWVCGHTSCEMIKNEAILDIIGVTSMLGVYMTGLVRAFQISNQTICVRFLNL
ncbi:hypothetical protein H5410_061350 [Solanum commersonii]|uniref:Uncharacterized protein n=1 Tax=Solanum commersonii TaxID=4109 RepID=A0A9J5W8W4_SOLCO|nr:hypothetical protein H5410_061350 [Solanum commersonii]